MRKTPKKVELALYLKNLLYNNEEVTIPGLGTLVTKYKPAEVDSFEKKITPPSKYLVFDETKTGPDTLLYEYYAYTNMGSRKDSVESITTMVNEIISKLDKGETVFLEGIGYFSKIDETIRFEKIQDYNYLTDTYGLSEVSFVPAEESFVPHKTSQQVYKPHKSHTTLYLFLILFVVIGGGIILYLNFPDITGFFNRNTANHIPNPVKKQIEKKTTADSTSGNQNLENFFDSATNKKNALAITNPAPVSNAKYYIIAGSFKTLEKATKLSKEMETEGYKNEIIRFDEKLYRISLGTYTDKAKAIDDMLKIRFTKGDDAVWLLTQKE